MSIRNQLLLATVFIAACGELKPKDTNTADGGSQVTDSHVVVTDEGSDVHSAVVDAHDEAAWIYLDLESSKEVSPSDPAHDSTWILASSAS